MIFDLLETESDQDESSREEEAKSLERNIEAVTPKIITTYAALSKKANSVGIFTIDLERKSSYYINFVIFLVIMI